MFKNVAKELKSFFKNTATYRAITETSTSSGVSRSYASKGSASCCFYEGNSADRYISDQLKAEVEGIIIHVPSDVTFTIADQDDVTLDDGRSFVVVHSDNVGNQDGIYVVGVKEKK